MRHEICSLEELEPGQMRAVEVDGISMVVIRTQAGGVHALRDFCPHMRAKLSPGLVLEHVSAPKVGRYALDEDQFVVRCPWHGYEFDVVTGECEADPRRARVKVFTAVVANGTIYVER